eukprot:1315259-Amorphochlora_amoeboformis.AAC.2
MQWRPAGAILGFLWVALSPPDDSSGSADEKAPQRTARPPISFPKGFLSRNRVKSAPKLRQPTLQEALPALNASKIREQQPRSRKNDLKFERLHGGVGVVRALGRIGL